MVNWVRVDRDSYVIKLDGQILDRVHFYKYLGIIIDDQLTFNRHIQDMNKIASHKLYMLLK